MILKPHLIVKYIYKYFSFKLSLSFLYQLKEIHYNTIYNKKFAFLQMNFTFRQNKQPSIPQVINPTSKTISNNPLSNQIEQTNQQKTIYSKQHSPIQQYCNKLQKLLLANNVLNSQINAATVQQKQLLDMITALQNNQAHSLMNKKRFRRSAKQIDKNHKCKIKNCGKSYGSQGSLAQHMKLKHSDALNQAKQGDSRQKDPC